MRKIIGFVTGGLKFNGNTLTTTALGGSESAMIYMAQELAKLGNEVYVFCECDEPGIFNNVVYDSNQRFKDKQYPQLDVCIVSRYLEFFQRPIDSNFNVYWVHDIPYTKLYNQMWQTDVIFCMSEYQKSLYTHEKYIEELFHVTKNGFDSELANQTTVRNFDKRRHHYIYASRPERGLKLLLEKVWPRVLAQDPLAQLHLCGYDNTLPQVEEMRPLYDEIDQLKENADNLIDHGPLTKKEYYNLLGKCAYMLYPTDFPEISCINAIEAQALGCLVISSDRYAVSETVKSDTLVKAEYSTDEYVDEFISKLNYYQDKVNWEIETDLSKKAIQEYAWKNIADQWNSYFDMRFVQRMDEKRYQVVNRLIYNSDIYAAWKLTGDRDYRHMLDCAAHNNLNYDVDDIEDDGHRDPDGIPRIRAISDLLKKYTNKNKKYTMLDLGCFSGLVTQSVLRHVGDRIEKVYAYDGAKVALERFKKHRHDDRIEYINDDVLNLEKHNLKADIVIVGELMEHIEDTVKFLDMLMTVAKQDTIFIFTTPYGPWESITLRQNPREKWDSLYCHIHNFEFSDILTIFADVQDTFFITRPYHMLFTNRGDSLDNWVYGFRYTKKPRFQYVNYEEKAIRTRPYYSISTCIIVKNEELNLARCLNSVKGISDEIIVVDTGSTDRTKEIAAKYTDKIYDFEWNGSFEDARNFSISKASCDWILYVDADEELFDSTILGQLVASEFYDGVVIEQRQVSVTGDATNENQQPTRLFRNHRNIKFYGLIHELPGFSENDFVEKSLNQREAYIAHYGYMNRDIITNEKLDRNHASLIKDLEKYPNRWFGKTYYIRDMYFFFLRDLVQQRKTNYHYIDEMLSSWDKEFRYKKVDHYQWDFAKNFAFHFVQALYKEMAERNIGIDGKLPFKKTLNFKLANNVEMWFRDQTEYDELVAEASEAISSDDDAIELVPILSARFLTNIPESSVPCGDCNACCRSLDVYLKDDEVLSGKYLMEFMPKDIVRVLNKKELPPNSGVFRLARNTDGTCIYLRNNQCSIYETRPYACRQYDCRSCDDVPELVAQARKEKFNINN